MKQKAGIPGSGLLTDSKFFKKRKGQKYFFSRPALKINAHGGQEITTTTVGLSRDVTAALSWADFWGMLFNAEKKRTYA